MAEVNIFVEDSNTVAAIVVSPTGEKGRSGTITVSDTITGEAGTEASVVNNGTSSDAELVFTIPRGSDGISGRSASVFNYKAKTNATSGYPGNGYLLWNNGVQLNSSSIIVSHINSDDVDLELILSFFVVGQKIFIQDKDDSSQNQVWLVSGTPTLTGANTSTAYFTFPVTLVSSNGTAFSNNEQIVFGSVSSATNSVTSSTTSDGTAALVVGSLEAFNEIFTTEDGANIYTNGTGAGIATFGESAHITTNGTGSFIQTGSTFRIFDGVNTTTLSGSQTSNRFIVLPDEDGTVALTSDITSYVTSSTTSDGTANISFSSITVDDTVTLNALTYNFGTGAADGIKSALEIVSSDITDATSDAIADTIAKRDNGGGVKFAYVRVIGGGVVFGSDGGSTTTFSESSTIHRTINLPDADGLLALTTSNVATATALQTARTINGVSFDGTANITVAVPISTGLTGAGTGVITALQINTGSAGAFVVNGGTATGMTLTGSTTFASGSTFTYGGTTAATHRTSLGVYSTRVVKKNQETRLAGTAIGGATNTADIDSSMTTNLLANKLYKVTCDLGFTANSTGMPYLEYTGSLQAFVTNGYYAGYTAGTSSGARTWTTTTANRIYILINQSFSPWNTHTFFVPTNSAGEFRLHWGNVATTNIIMYTGIIEATIVESY